MIRKGGKQTNPAENILWSLIIAMTMTIVILAKKLKDCNTDREAKHLGTNSVSIKGVKKNVKQKLKM